MITDAILSKKNHSLRDVHVPRIPWPRLAIPFAVIKITIPADSRWTYRSINQYDFRLHATRIIPLSLPIHPSSMGFVKGVDAQSDSRLNRSPNKGDGQFAYRFKGWSIFKPRFKRGLSPSSRSFSFVTRTIIYLSKQQAHWLNAVTGLERQGDRYLCFSKHGHAIWSQPRSGCLN